MPEKDGDEGKSTKSVVNKKQKQMMGEEGYDVARDMGRVRPSKDKKDATTMPPSKEMEKTRKVYKGPSALDIVKKKYKGQIMKMEELDLTQVAEAFGGHIVEQTDQEKEKEKKILRKRVKRTENPFKKMGETPKDALDFTDKVVKSLPQQERPEPVQKAMAKDSIERQRGSLTPDRDAYLEPGTNKIRVKPIVSPVNPDSSNQPDDGTVAPTIGGLKTYKVNPETLRTGVNPTGERKRGRPVGAKDKTQRFKGTRAAKDEVLAAMTPGQRERNLRRIQKDIDDRNPTIQTQVGPVPYRNRRVPKTRTLVPVFDRTPQIMKPDTDELLKFKDFRKKTKTTTAELDKTKEFKAPPIPKPKKSLEDPEIKKTDTDTQTQTQGDDGGTRGKGPRVTTSGGGSTGGGGAYSSIKSFAKTPAGNLISYDMGKGILSKIMKMRKVLSVEKPTKTGRISAGS